MTIAKGYSKLFLKSKRRKGKKQPNILNIFHKPFDHNYTGSKPVRLLYASFEWNHAPPHGKRDA